MWEDPIVKEIREFRAQHAARFGNDLQRIFEDLRRQQNELAKQGFKIVSLPPRKPQRQHGEADAA